ncbi:hypothetical protein [Priestia megaterium]|uniref:hypothetical protein n=1 Tax=Priestia megaterium TaxID=1404 RepID=UPI000D50F416|nr:hypothetical protein [Priestia megaterium]PVE71136.1 hypothetical protein DC428_11920 [Priestia megaterium]PVE89191.1 hypothetical protein DC421_03765 [Priestia megaterium]PVE92881.1 hypothetical protein DC426_05420 [Priestia megaterium]PVE99049.1 hypothetical protein DC433_14555 [Priestia megaterium]RMA90882.1 hypothetical protein DEU44_2969 [Priestia megaterium]
MMKLRLIAIFLLLLVAGCQNEDEMDKKEISKLASEVAATYMKDEEDIDFVPKDVEFLGGEDLSTVLVHGYAKGKDKKKEMSVTVDYGDDYRVTGYGYH